MSKNNQELWREFRNIRNMVNKLNKNLKENYYNNRLNRQYDLQNSDNMNFSSDCNSSENVYQNLDIESLKYKSTTCHKKMWNTVKNLSQKNKQTPPRCIVFDNQKVTSLKNIANISNQFFIDKILKLRGQFVPSNL